MNSPKPDQRIEQVAGTCGVPVAAVEMAVNCLSWTAYNPDAVAGHLTASDFCRTFLEAVMDTHLEKTEATLRDWNIARSEDLGRIVYALTDVGLAKPSENDRIEDFENVFDLKERFFAWNPESDEDNGTAKNTKRNGFFV